MFQDLSVPTREIAYGSAGLLVCLVLYLVWWCITFKPGGGGSTPFGTACILLATVAGIIGVGFTLHGLSGIPQAAGAFPNSRFLIGGIVAYAALALVTYLLLSRPITTELFLIVGWAVLELSVIHSLAGAATLSTALTLVLAAVLIVLVIASLVCYVLYYRLGPQASYLDGMGPLIGGGVFQVVLICVLAFGAR